MPVQHKIDDDAKLITTIWSGDANDKELSDALADYQQNIKSLPLYASYNEILDFSGASNLSLSSEGIKKLAYMSSMNDQPGVKTRLAIVVNKPIAYGLARMYQIYRSLLPSGSKDVRVFKNYQDCLEWIGSKRDSD
jgi:hypothetical protein